MALLRKLYKIDDSFDEIIMVTTDDGWRLPLYRHLPKGKKRSAHPVLLCHGLTGSRFNLDSEPGMSMAAYLADRGYDSYVVSLRGDPFTSLNNNADAKKNKYEFDDYIKLDLPQIIEKVKQHTGAEKVHWIGHSMGAMIGYAYLGTRPDTIQSSVLLGGPVFFEKMNYIFRTLLKFKALLKIFPVAFAGNLIKPLIPFQGRGIDFFIYNQTNPDNVDKPVFRRIAFNVVSNTGMQLMMQMSDFLSNNVFRSTNGIDYRARISDIEEPALVFAGPEDRVAGFENVIKGYDLLPEDNKKLIVLSREQGFAFDYGHMDMTLGKNAPREIFPRVGDWLDQYDG
jgi:poly(3-hydroxyalkanoate) synthetase